VALFLSAAAPAPPQNVCTQLRAVVAAAPTAFAGLKGAPQPGFRRPTWRSQLQLPHLRAPNSCHVDGTFWCMIQPEPMLRAVQTCFPNARARTDPNDDDVTLFDIDSARISIDELTEFITFELVPRRAPPPAAP
jgi:hypothetical protein